MSLFGWRNDASGVVLLGEDDRGPPTTARLTSRGGVWYRAPWLDEPAVYELPFEFETLRALVNEDIDVHFEVDHAALHAAMSAAAELIRRSAFKTASVQGDPMSDEFKPGDVVRLKSGGPMMTVAASDGVDVACIWFPVDIVGTSQTMPMLSPFPTSALIRLGTTP